MHQLDLPSDGFWKVLIGYLLSDDDDDDDEYDDDDDDDDDDWGDDEDADNDVDNSADDDGAMLGDAMRCDDGASESERNNDNHYLDYNVIDYNMNFWLLVGIIAIICTHLKIEWGIVLKIFQAHFFILFGTECN